MLYALCSLRSAAGTPPPGTEVARGSTRRRSGPLGQGAMRRDKRIEETRSRFFTLSLDMLCIAGFAGYFYDLNPAWEKTLGFTLADLKSKPFVEFVHPDDRDETIPEWQRWMPGRLAGTIEH